MNLRTNLLLLSTAALLCSEANAADLLVPQQFGTIQAAVDAAQPGDKLILKKGTYGENVVVADKVGLTILGKKGATIAPTTPGLGLRLLNSEFVKVRGLTVRDTSATAIQIEGCADVLIRNCTVRNAGFDAILAFDSTRVTVLKNDLADLVGSGVALLGDTGEIRGNLIARSDRHGVFVAGPNFTIEGNSIEDTVLPGVEARTFDNIHPNLLIAENSLDRTNGILVLSYAQVSILDNTVRSAEADAVLVLGCVGVLMAGNLVKESGQDGIEIGQPSILLSNKVVKSGGDGMVLRTGSDGSLVKKSKIKRAGAVGMRLISSGNTLEKNKATKSAEFDLVDSGAQNLLLGNTFPKIAP